MNSKLNKKWFTYFDDGSTSPFPCFKIKVKDDIQSPVACLPVQTAKGKKISGSLARLIVKLVNQHITALKKGENPASLKIALEESVRLQSHYAKLLNMHDGGERKTFSNADEWIARLEKIRSQK